MVKHTQPTNCLSVFDHFVGLALSINLTFKEKSLPKVSTCELDLYCPIKTIREKRMMIALSFGGDLIMMIVLSLNMYFLFRVVNCLCFT